MSIGPIRIPGNAGPVDVARLHSDCGPTAIASGSVSLRVEPDQIDPNEGHALRPIPIIVPRREVMPDLTDTFED